jgi:hypothetical protein
MQRFTGCGRCLTCCTSSVILRVLLSVHSIIIIWFVNSFTSLVIWNMLFSFLWVTSTFLYLFLSSFLVYLHKPYLSLPFSLSLFFFLFFVHLQFLSVISLTSYFLRFLMYSFFIRFFTFLSFLSCFLTLSMEWNRNKSRDLIICHDNSNNCDYAPSFFLFAFYFVIFLWFRFSLVLSLALCLSVLTSYPSNRPLPISYHP